MIDSLNQTEKLDMAAMTANWLGEMEAVVKSTTSGDAELDAETSRHLAVAKCALLYWRLSMGHQAGLIKLTPIDCWQEDECD